MLRGVRVSPVLQISCALQQPAYAAVSPYELTICFDCYTLVLSFKLGHSKPHGPTPGARASTLLLIFVNATLGRGTSLGYSVGLDFPATAAMVLPRGSCLLWDWRRQHHPPPWPGERLSPYLRPPNKDMLGP